MLNIADVIIEFIPALVMLSWTIRFQTTWVLTSIPALAILMLAVLSLSADPHISFYDAGSLVTYDLAPTSLLLLNLLASSGVIVAGFIVLKRTIASRQEE